MERETTHLDVPARWIEQVNVDLLVKDAGINVGMGWIRASPSRQGGGERLRKVC